MSDFEDVGNVQIDDHNRLRVSKGGDVYYVMEEWLGRDGIYRMAKSKKGNPYMMRLKAEGAYDVLKQLAIVVTGNAPASEDDVPF